MPGVVTVYVSQRDKEAPGPRPARTPEKQTCFESLCAEVLALLSARGSGPCTCPCGCVSTSWVVLKDSGHSGPQRCVITKADGFGLISPKSVRPFTINHLISEGDISFLRLLRNVNYGPPENATKDSAECVLDCVLAEY